MKRQTRRSLAVRCAHRYSTVMGHSSGQCTNGQDAEEDDYEHSLSASCLSCKKHTDVDSRDRAANTLPDQPLEPDMTSPFLKIEYAIGLLNMLQRNVHTCMHAHSGTKMHRHPPPPPHTHTQTFTHTLSRQATWYLPILAL